MLKFGRHAKRIGTKSSSLNLKIQVLKDFPRQAQCGTQAVISKIDPMENFSRQRLLITLHEKDAEAFEGPSLRSDESAHE